MGLGFGFWLRVWGLRMLRISALLGPLDSDSVVLDFRGFWDAGLRIESLGPCAAGFWSRSLGWE